MCGEESFQYTSAQVFRCLCSLLWHEPFTCLYHHDEYMCLSLRLTHDSRNWASQIFPADLSHTTIQCLRQKIVRYAFSDRECGFLRHSLIFQSCSIDSQRRLLLLFVCTRCPHRTPKILFVLQDCDCTPGIFKIAFGLWDLQSQKSAFSPLRRPLYNDSSSRRCFIFKENVRLFENKTSRWIENRNDHSIKSICHAKQLLFIRWPILPIDKQTGLSSNEKIGSICWISTLACSAIDSSVVMNLSFSWLCFSNSIRKYCRV